MKKSTKIIIGIIATIVVVITAFYISSYYLLKSYVPNYNGKTESELINDEIVIYRDSLGIPFIISQNEFDAAFALGFLHAQERLFQMDVARRAGEGRLSEVFGSKTVPFDKMFRTLRIKKVVDEFFPLIDLHGKKILTAYADGVNFFIKENDGKYSIEFDILGYRPEKWKPEHSLMIAKLMAFELNMSWWSDIAISHLLQIFDEEKVKEIIPDYPENAPTIIPSNLSSAPRITLDLIKTDRDFRNFSGFTGTHIGSNSWVVNSEKSISGKPIIANDPHLAFQVPGKWYVAVIRSDNWNVEGFSIPGLPAIVIGKNKNISWALTNVMADDSDYYIEKFDSSNTKYLLDGKWRYLQIEKDTIIVKDSLNAEIEIKLTHRGPVVSEAHAFNELFPNQLQNKANISMRWTALEFSDEVKGILKINKAENWNEFLDGVKEFTVPGQNFIFADDEGNIGYVCAARLPIRQNVSPTLVYDGTTSASDWKGFVPFEEMPKLFNPPQNYIASANNKTISNYKYHISNIWEPSSRIERINEFLRSKEIFCKEDFKELQMDFTSHYAMKLVPYILNAFMNAKVDDENLNTALELLQKWDFVMSEKSQTPTIYNVFLVHLLKNIFEDEMGEELFNEYIFLANIPYRVILELLEKPKSTWFNNINTTEIEIRDDIIRLSLVDALVFLEDKFGKNLASWQWGELHQIEFKHFFDGINPIVDNIVNVGPFPIGGDGTTVFNTEYSFTEPYLNRLGPSMRYIFDFSKPDEFLYVLPTGQSGHIISPNYKNMTKHWLAGNYIKIKTDEESIEKSIYKFTINKK